MAKKLNSIFKFPTALLTMFSIVGCANMPAPSEMQNVANERIIIHRDLEDEIGVVSERVRNIGTLSQAEVSIKNFTEDRYTVEYKFDWYDAEGFRIDSLSSWNRVTITPNAITDLRSIGKHEKAKTYKLNIRLPDDAFITEKNEYD